MFDARAGLVNFNSNSLSKAMIRGHVGLQAGQADLDSPSLSKAMIWIHFDAGVGLVDFFFLIKSNDLGTCWFEICKLILRSIKAN